MFYPMENKKDNNLEETEEEIRQKCPRKYHEWYDNNNEKCSWCETYKERLKNENR